MPFDLYLPMICCIYRHIHLNLDITKPTKWLCAQRRLISAWASAQSDQSSLSAWWKLGPLATHWTHSEDSDQTGRMPRMIWVFAGRTLILLVLSCCGSFGYFYHHVGGVWSDCRFLVSDCRFGVSPVNYPGASILNNVLYTSFRLCKKAWLHDYCNS